MQKDTVLCNFLHFLCGFLRGVICVFCKIKILGKSHSKHLSFIPLPHGDDHLERF
jgi:hypothetical protein